MIRNKKIETLAEEDIGVEEEKLTLKTFVLFRFSHYDHTYPKPFSLSLPMLYISL